MEPTRTATRFELSVEGGSNPLVVGVDDDAGVVTVSGGRNGLSELVISGGSLPVLAGDVGADVGDATWVEVPLTVVDARLSAIAAPDRALLALSRDVTECRRPSSDAAFIVGVLLGEGDADGSLCRREDLTVFGSAGIGAFKTFTRAGGV